MKKVDMVVDLQFGSTGKGALAGYLSTVNDYDVVVTANMPNAGHTFIDGKGQKMVHKVLPSGIASPGIKWVLIAPGAVFDFDRLVFEMDQAKKFGYTFKLGIHEHAVVLADEYKKLEQAFPYQKIGSTGQGSAEAMMAKIRRDPQFNPTVRAKLGDAPYVLSHTEYMDVLYRAKSILAEGAQGYSLGINAGFWPYCTSRDCTPARFAADMLISLSWIDRIYGTARTYPIRVGGTSGPGYRDQEEITWESIGQTPELTTVTQRQRRIFTFSKRQMWEAMMICQPTHVFLNFCNYMENNIHELNKIIDTIDWFGRELECGGVKYTGWGPNLADIKDIDHCTKTSADASASMDDSAITEDTERC